MQDYDIVFMRDGQKINASEFVQTAAQLLQTNTAAHVEAQKVSVDRSVMMMTGSSPEEALLMVNVLEGSVHDGSPIVMRVFPGAVCSVENGPERPLLKVSLPSPEAKSTSLTA